MFLFPILISAVLLGSVLVWGGVSALVLALLLVLLEVTLSFDNAVVNARVLRDMDALWQKRFMTWGILVAVFGTRIFLPFLIVGASVGLAPWIVAHLAFFEPETYRTLLEHSAHMVHAFGGMFLLMVSLKYFFDTEKNTHWIHSIERHLARWGRVEAVEIALALLVLLGISSFVAGDIRAQTLMAGVVGIVLFILVQGIANAFSVEAGSVARGGLASFVYLEVLDSAFSLDGVIGAFALTTEVGIIAVGLGVGALFVRTLTVYMVRHRALETVRYLEHGAHWAIFGLASTMLAGLMLHIPEFVVASVGFFFIGAAYFSSLREKKA
jgi:hypothetical protein